MSVACVFAMSNLAPAQYRSRKATEAYPEKKIHHWAGLSQMHRSRIYASRTVRPAATQIPQIALRSLFCPLTSSSSSCKGLCLLVARRAADLLARTQLGCASTGGTCASPAHLRADARTLGSSSAWTRAQDADLGRPDPGRFPLRVSHQCGILGKPIRSQGRSRLPTIAL